MTRRAPIPPVLALGDCAPALLGLALLGVVLGLPACYEIPPTVPDRYVGSEPPPGWPPPAAYHSDPLERANRWFHRAFARRDPAGRLGAAWAHDPLPFADYVRVDVAELSVLLDGMATSDGLASLSGGRADRPPAPILGSDLLQVALLLSRGAEVDPSRARLVAGLVALARRVGGEGLDGTRGLAEDELPTSAEPPPLRTGGWLEAPPPDSPDLAPSVGDCRWSRILYRGGSASEAPRWVLLRLRVGVDGGGGPLLLPFASECLEIRLESESEEEGPPARLWLFDRARWIVGLDPWVLVFEEESGAAGRLVHASARDAARPVPGVAAGTEPEPETLPYSPILPRPWRDRQREAIEDLLRRALGHTKAGSRDG